MLHRSRLLLLPPTPAPWAEPAAASAPAVGAAPPAAAPVPTAAAGASAGPEGVTSKPVRRLVQDPGREQHGLSKICAHSSRGWGGRVRLWVRLEWASDRAELTVWPGWCGVLLQGLLGWVG